MVNINFVGGNFVIVGVLLLWSVLLTEHFCICLCCEYLQPGVHPINFCLQNHGETLTLSCKVSGFNFGQYGMHWIRQSAGKALNRMGAIWYDASKTVYAKSVEGPGA